MLTRKQEKAEKVERPLSLPPVPLASPPPGPTVACHSHSAFPASQAGDTPSTAPPKSGGYAACLRSVSQRDYTGPGLWGAKQNWRICTQDRLKVIKFLPNNPNARTRAPIGFCSHSI